ncbi:cyclin-dependent kinase inhibitor, partial [Staphylococcus aureus]
DDDCVTTHHNNKQYHKTELENKLNARLQRKIEEWNFDFVKGLPLKGRFDWIPVNHDHETTTKTNFEKSQKLRSILPATSFFSVKLNS